MIECVGAMVSDARAEQRRLDAEMRDVWRGSLARGVVEARSLTRTEAEMINRTYTCTNCRICLGICFALCRNGRRGWGSAEEYGEPWKKQRRDGMAIVRQLQIQENQVGKHKTYCTDLIGGRPRQIGPLPSASSPPGHSTLLQTIARMFYVPRYLPTRYVFIFSGGLAPHRAITDIDIGYVQIRPG